MSFSIRLTDEEKKLTQAYARIHGISVGEAMKQALFEKIEDEFDIADLELALKDFEKDPTTYTVEEAKKCWDYEISGSFDKESPKVFSWLRYLYKEITFSIY